MTKMIAPCAQHGQSIDAGPLWAADEPEGFIRGGNQGYFGLTAGSPQGVPGSDMIGIFEGRARVKARGDPSPRQRRRASPPDRPQLQCQSQHDLAAHCLTGARWRNPCYRRPDCDGRRITTLIQPNWDGTQRRLLEPRSASAGLPNRSADRKAGASICSPDG